MIPPVIRFYIQSIVSLLYIAILFEPWIYLTNSFRFKILWKQVRFNRAATDLSRQKPFWDVSRLSSLVNRRFAFHVIISMVSLYIIISPKQFKAYHDTVQYSDCCHFLQDALLPSMGIINYHVSVLSRKIYI